jgi:hypothetical protein
VVEGVLGPTPLPVWYQDLPKALQQQRSQRHLMRIIQNPTQLMLCWSLSDIKNFAQIRFHDRVLKDLTCAKTLASAGEKTAFSTQQ